MVCGVLLTSELLLLDRLKLLLHVLNLSVVDEEVVLKVKHSELFAVFGLGRLRVDLGYHLNGLLVALLARLLLLLLVEHLLQVLRQFLKLHPLESPLRGGQLLSRLVEDVLLLFLGLL